MATRRSRFVTKPRAVRSFKQRKKDFLAETAVNIKNARARRKKLAAAKRENEAELKVYKAERRSAKVGKGPWESEIEQRKRRRQRGSNG